MLSPINYITVENEILRVKYTPKIDKDFVYLYAYVLLSYWNESYAERIEITADEFSELKYGNKLNFDLQTEYKVLELLNEKGLIRLNRQLSPYTIMKTSNKDDLIKKLYSELF